MNYIFDIDNTIFFREDEETSEKMLIALESLAKKHNLFFATRREKYNLDPIQKLIDNGLVKNVFCGNGAYDLNGELPTSFLNNARMIIDYLISNDYHFLLETTNGIKINRSGRLYKMEDFYNQQYIEKDIDKEVVSILISSPKSSELEALFEDNNYHYVYSEEYENYSIANKNATKEKMINTGVSGEYIGFGDSLSDDVEFLTKAQQGYLIEQEAEGINTITRTELLELLSLEL